MRHLTKALQRVGEGDVLSAQWTQAISWLEENRPADLWNIESGLNFTNGQEDLGKAAAEALFKKDVEKAMSMSPSRLEKYSRCPFAHLVSYGLKPEERRVYEAAPREIGDIYHHCLMTLTNKLTKEGLEVTNPKSPWMTISKEDCYDIVAKEVESLSAEYREGILKASKVDEYRGERIMEICQQVCWTAVQQVRAGRIVSINPEISFGRRGKLPPIEVQLEDQKVYLEGIIDRVDYLPDDRVKIIDYKTGNESFSIKEAQDGYRLQLMMYLQAACEDTKKPAGVFYFRIKEPMAELTADKMDAETVEKEIKKSFKLDGILVDDPAVISDIAGEFEGFSEIVPIRATKEGVKNSGNEGLLPEADFRELQGAVFQKIKEACSDLLAGKIQAHPMKTRQQSACTYCQFKGICRFDTVFEDCKYNIVG